MHKSFKSSIEKMGKVVDQVVGFSDGEQKSFKGVITKSIEVGLFTKFKTTDGKLVAINHRRVNWFETH